MLIISFNLDTCRHTYIRNTYTARSGVLVCMYVCAWYIYMLMISFNLDTDIHTYIRNTYTHLVLERLCVCTYVCAWWIVVSIIRTCTFTSYNSVDRLCLIKTPVYVVHMFDVMYIINRIILSIVSVHLITVSKHYWQPIKSNNSYSRMALLDNITPDPTG